MVCASERSLAEYHFVQLVFPGARKEYSMDEPSTWEVASRMVTPSQTFLSSTSEPCRGISAENSTGSLSTMTLMGGVSTGPFPSLSEALHLSWLLGPSSNV